MKTHWLHLATEPIILPNTLCDNTSGDPDEAWMSVCEHTTDEDAALAASSVCDHAAALLTDWHTLDVSALGSPDAHDDATLIALAYDTLATRGALARLRPELDDEHATLCDALDTLILAHTEPLCALAALYPDPPRWLDAAEQWADTLLELVHWQHEHGVQAAALFDALDRAECVAAFLGARPTPESDALWCALEDASALAIEQPELFLPARHHILAHTLAQRPPDAQSAALANTQRKHLAVLGAVEEAERLRTFGKKRDTRTPTEPAERDGLEAQLIDLRAILAARRGEPLELPEHRPLSAAAAGHHPDTLPTTRSWRAPEGQRWRAVLSIPPVADATPDAPVTLTVFGLDREHLGAYLLGKWFPATNTLIQAQLTYAELNTLQASWSGHPLVVVSHHNDQLHEHTGLIET